MEGNLITNGAILYALYVAVMMTNAPRDAEGRGFLGRVDQRQLSVADWTGVKLIGLMLVISFVAHLILD